MKFNSKKLRIGNYVQGISNLTETIELISKNEVDTDKHDALPINQIEPILISENWFITLGFKKDGSGNFWKKVLTSGYIEFLQRDDFYYPILCLEPEMSNDNVQVIGLNRIRYVHELQNLFFAIEQKELVKI